MGKKKKCLAAVAEKRTAAAAALMALVRRKFLYFYYYFCSHFIIERRGHGDGRETGDNGSASSPRPAYYNINRIDIRHELKSPRGGRPLRWGVRYWHFDPYHTKKFISLSSLSTLKPHILFLLLFLLLALAAASSRWHTVSPSLIFRPSQASRMRFESAAFPSHTGGPHFAISAKIDEGIFWIKWSTPCSGRVGREIPSYPDCHYYYTQVGLHTSCETQKARFKQRKLMHYSTIEKKKERKKKKRRGFPIDFRMEQPKYGGRKKNSKHLLW